MSFFDWLVIIVMAVVGWLVVSFVLNRAKPQAEDADAETLDGRDPRDARNPRVASDAGDARTDGDATFEDPLQPQTKLLSLDAIGSAWSSILGVPGDASGAVIEQAYHAKLAECDRVRFDVNASAASRQQAEEQRARVDQAYEFIRPSRP